MSAPQEITVKFFALLREQAGCRELKISTSAPTPAALYLELCASHALKLPPNLLTYAINERYVRADDLLFAGDRVAFIPPVAGG